MYYLKYRLTSLAPLVFTMHAGDRNTVATEQFIPGSSVLGLLAKRVIARKNLGETAHTDQQFYDWFLSGSLNIGGAFILSEDTTGTHYYHLPVPLSIRKEKKSEVIRDYLFAVEDPHKPTKPIDSFCVLNGNTLQTRDVERRLNFHHARDPEKGITQPGIIFTYESIEPSQTFEGIITGEQADLQQLLTRCGHAWNGYLGRSKNAQYGKVRFEILRSQPTLYQTQISGQQPLALTLLSDTILYNANGFSTTDLSVLEAYLTHAAGTAVRIVKSKMKQGTVETFLNIWNFPRPSETCILAGSAFLLEIPNGNPAVLADLEPCGIGERTHEGFGQCRFDWQTAHGTTPLAHREELSDPAFAPKEPQTPMPESTKEILRTLLRDALKTRMREKAMNDQQTCTRNLPSKTLLARLEALANQLPRIEFVEQIYQLRQIARTQLEHCRGKGFTLFSLLTGRFVLTEPVLAALKAEGIPEEMLAKLETLKDQPEIRQQTFVAVLQDTLGETLTEQDTRVILRHAVLPNTDLSAATVLKESEKALCDTIGGADLESDEFEQKLYRLYFSTFFSILRKRVPS